MPEKPFQFSEQIEADIDVYRPLNRWSVFSLLLALGSFVTLVLLHPAWWAVPILGMIIGGIALKQIAKNDGSQSGKMVALLGIALSVILLTAAGVSKITRYQQAVIEAKKAAATWFEALQTGRFQRAHQLTLIARQRCPNDKLLSKWYEEHTNLSRELDQYIERPAVLTLIKWGEDTTVEYQKTISQKGTLDRKTLENEYLIKRTAPGKNESIRIRLLMIRKRAAKTNQFYWQVRGVREVE